MSVTTVASLNNGTIQKCNRISPRERLNATARDRKLKTADPPPRPPVRQGRYVPPPIPNAVAEIDLDRLNCRPTLTNEEVYQLFAAILRDSNVMIRACKQLSASDIPDDLADFKLIWTIASGHFGKRQEPISRGLLASEVNTATELDPDCLSQEQESDLEEFLEFAYSRTPNDMPLDKSLELLRKFLEESLTRDAARALSLGQNDQAVLDNVSDTLGQMLEKLSAIHSIDSPSRARFRAWSAGELDTADLEDRYIVPGLLAEQQLCGFVGPKKGCKSLICSHVSIGVAGGQPLLGGHFRPTRQHRVVYCVGEGSLAGARNVARRAAKEFGYTKLSEVPNWHLVGGVPRLDQPHDMQVFVAEVVQQYQPEVLFLDPFKNMYGGQDAANIFAMDKIFEVLIRLANEEHLTPVLAHHLKSTRPNPLAAPDLDDAAFSGFAEDVAQWWLLGRRERYVSGSGEHRLWFTVGGRAGHDSAWTMDIDEGPSNQPTRRHLAFSLDHAGEGVSADKQRRTSEREGLKSAELKAADKRHYDMVAGQLATCPGRQANQETLKGLTHLNGSQTSAALSRLLQMGLVCKIPISPKRFEYQLIRPGDDLRETSAKENDRQRKRAKTAK